MRGQGSHCLSQNAQEPKERGESVPLPIAVAVLWGLLRFWQLKASEKIILKPCRLSGEVQQGVQLAYIAKKLMFEQWRWMERVARKHWGEHGDWKSQSLLHCITMPSSLHVSGSKWQNICSPWGTYFDHDFQKVKELKQHHACKMDKKCSGACKCSSAPNKGAETDLNEGIFSCLTTVMATVQACRCSRKQFTI